MTFVRQLDLIDIGKTRVGIAVRDYIRAFTQRSRWSDDNLLLPGEISKYERRRAWTLCQRSRVVCSRTPPGRGGLTVAQQGA
ncbi:ABC-three component system protein [Streptomyces lincolnensis]|uniref:ABC-three component system protein n=1 Tax=Streptomyces lincolnensis TaxID=1915 RepID=UPI0033C0B592